MIAYLYNDLIGFFDFTVESNSCCGHYSSCRTDLKIFARVQNGEQQMFVEMSSDDGDRTQEFYFTIVLHNRRIINGLLKFKTRIFAPVPTYVDITEKKTPTGHDAVNAVINGINIYRNLTIGWSICRR